MATRPSENFMVPPYNRTHGGLNSPLIVDSDEMGGNIQDIDLEFFNSTFPHGGTPASSGVLDEDILNTPLNNGDPSLLQAPGYISPAVFTPKNLQQPPSGLSQSQNNRHSISAPSSASPASSSQDSSSDSSRRHKRKSSSSSSHSGLAGADVAMADDPDPSEWKVDDLMMGGDGPNYASFDGLLAGFSSFEGTSDPLAMQPDVETSNKAMENHFDFDSAASSPSPLEMAASTHHHPAKVTFSGFSNRSSPPASNRYKADGRFPMRRKAGSPGVTFPARGGRETSPLSAMITSHESSPSALFNNHSPSPDNAADYVSGTMLGGATQNSSWTTSFDFGNPGAQSSPSSSRLPTSPVRQSLASPFLPSRLLGDRDGKATLTIHPTPLKSRVETQIPIKMSLYPMPAGVTKLHLPTHTISKPKLLAKPPPTPSPDTLELHTMLVCTSAMQNPENLQRAFARAAGIELPKTKTETISRSSSQDGQSDVSDDDESKPLNGGEVRICNGCITRERKRAARKKVKKVEEEESWYRDEHKRVIVFNTHEIKDWQQPSKEASVEPGTERTPPPVPTGAMQVDAPMRIACYCRHQNEKLGFQVIFTIKDHTDQVIAQAITSSIMITDDHKTHIPPPTNPQPLNADESNSQPTTSGGFSSNRGLRVSPGAPSVMSPFRLSHSASDLQTLPHSFGQQFPPSSTPYTMSQTTSASHTPRNLSRQASFSGPSGPSAKKRKASGSGKVPTGLAMTRLETPQMTPQNISNTRTASTAPSSATSPFFSNSYSIQAENPFMPTVPVASQFNTGPPTPNSNDHGFFTPALRSQSMENLPMHALFSAPSSTHPSRAPSPIGSQRNAQAYQQQAAQMAQAVANGLYGMPVALNPHRPPIIHKLIPSEGPKAGGIEVTCLGSGFCQGLEVMFGDSLATTTTYWGDTSLVCLLPPALTAGTVPVTFKHEQQQLQQFTTLAVPKQHVFFKYVDDDEQQLLRLALSVLGHKMTGRMEDVGDIARRIIGTSTNVPWGSGTGNSPPGGGQQRPASAFDTSMLGMMDVEAALLRCLDLIDLDDSPNQARLNLRRGSGQTMLHLACSLGFHRFVAALLARGANPEPRDKCGYTPMHYAAMHNQPQIVRRLILSGADPTIRTLQGYTPAELASSEDVLKSTRRVEHHTRHRSGGSIKSKQNSAVSLRSLWEPASPSHTVTATMGTNEFGDSEASDDEDKDDDDLDSVSEADLWMRSKRSSRRVSMAADSPSPGLGKSDDASQSKRGLLPPGATPAAAMVAWRHQLSNHLQHIQQLWNLPNLPNFPQIPPMPALPDYQNYLGNPMGRLNSLVPLRTPSQPGTSSLPQSQAPKETDYRWWELFSVPSAPPAYEEIFPQSDANVMDMKKSSAAEAALDMVADQKCAEIFDAHSAESSSAGGRSSPTIELRIGKMAITKEAQEELRAAHARKVKKIKSDRNLFFIWIPILVIIVMAMLKNVIPQCWNGAVVVYFYIRSQNPERLVEEVF